MLITALLAAVAAAWAGQAFAQNPVVYEVSGRVCSGFDGSPIQFAHIVNINRNTACISDTSGRFRMLMKAADTVRVSCIGYSPAGFTIFRLAVPGGDQMIDLGCIEMSPMVYELSEVNIYAERWKSFLFDYSNAEKKSEPYYVESIERWKENIIDIDELRLISQSSRRPGIALNFDFRQRKNQKRLEQFKRQEDINAEYAQKYNPKVVSEITGMSEQEAERFIFHFGLSREFIVSKNDYDIYILVKQLYREYQRNKEK